MNRQQLRKETRDINKALVKAAKTTEYKQTVSFFQGLTEDDLAPLKDKTHTDTELQEKFNRYFPNMQYIVRLEKRLYQLANIAIKKQNVSLVKQD